VSDATIERAWRGTAPGLYTPGRRPAAVLVPVYPGAEGPTLLLIRRTPVGHHGGQVAFPGGRPEPADASLEETALREAREEVGIDPAGVRITHLLPVVETMTSNYAIFAYVGRLAKRPGVRLQVSEVAAVLDVPVRALLAPGLPIEEDWEFPLPGQPGTVVDGPIGAEQAAVATPRLRRVRYFPWGEDKIWGATSRILEHLLEALRTGALAL
jgi:8-oxo-dGTP pyrophosphatase MutT (NUDIX family)